jgi:L,D-peptidoglycan transpeptidase YkuD (ErfK/YbiS/YcfS/YnhG family)
MVPIAEIRLVGPGQIDIAGKRYACAVGKGGIGPDKREGDHKTPAGSFAMRGCYYRPDRLADLRTGLPLTALCPDDGWCDDPAHPSYNTPVKLPFAASHEVLWREDHCYDLIIPLGYNDHPVVPGKGSAIFLHCMHDSGRATEGCIAMRKEDLLAVLPRFDLRTMVTI